MRNVRQWISHAICLLALTMGATLGDAPRYTVTDLGQAGQISCAEALNNRGQVTGWQDRGSFLWENGKQQIISTESYQGAHGINEEGQVVGIPGEIHLFRSGSTLSGASAFVWDRGHLDYLPGFSNAYSINAKGQIAGQSSNQATLWERRHVTGALNDAPDFIWQSLPAHKIALLPGYPYSIFYGLNDGGEAVGVVLRDLNDIPKHGCAFRYQAGRASLLPMPFPEKGGSSAAFSINEAGQVVGMSHSPSSFWQATFWPPDGPPQRLPTLPSYSEAQAHSINNAGQVVGWASRRGIGRACLWQNGTAYDLNLQIPPDSGWTLQEARAINDKGWIVGGGTLHGEYHAFLLVPTSAP